MVRISAELVRESPQFLNPLKQREIDLRSNKIPIVENLGATLDQFDAIDLSDNDISRLDGFPTLKRLKTLFINNNRITKIANNLHQFLPNLDELILTNNNIQEFVDLEAIAGFKTVTRLSLLRNPVTTRKYYREFLIYRMPQLVLLDFRKIKDRERAMAARLFSGKEGEKIIAELLRIANVSDAAPATAPGQTGPPPPPSAVAANGPQVAGLTPAQVASIKAAIGRATTLQEVHRLEAILQSGAIPDDFLLTNGGEDTGEMEH